MGKHVKNISKSEVLGGDLLILVTLGTQLQSFDRLLRYVERSGIEDEIIVQAGHTKYNSNVMRIFDFISYDEMNALIDRANFVITHGGTGSILTPLKKGKKVIACPRLKKYGEHVDDHQTEIVAAFVQRGHILALETEDEDFSEVISRVRHFQPKTFISNTEYFIYKLRKEINQYLV